MIEYVTIGHMDIGWATFSSNSHTLHVASSSCTTCSMTCSIFRLRLRSPIILLEESLERCGSAYVVVACTWCALLLSSGSRHWCH